MAHNSTMQSRMICWFIATSLVAMVTSAARPTHAPAANLTTVLSARSNLSVVSGLLQSTGLLDILMEDPAITLFLPTNEAMAKVPRATLNALHKDKQMLTDLLGYHAVVGEKDRISSRRNNDRVLMSAAGKPIRINNYYGAVTSVEGIKISHMNVPVANGYINEIDGLMSPATDNIVDIISKRSDMTTLRSMLSTTGLTDVVRVDHNITVFAPTDAAFAKVEPAVMSFLQKTPGALKNVLLFHVVNRLTLYSIGMHNAQMIMSADRAWLMVLEDGHGKFFINNAEVTERDISADNGVLHAIDDVMIPTKEFVALQKAGIVD